MKTGKKWDDIRKKQGQNWDENRLKMEETGTKRAENRQKRTKILPDKSGNAGLEVVVCGP